MSKNKIKKRNFVIIIIFILAIIYMINLDRTASTTDDLPMFVSGEQVVKFENNIVPSTISSGDNLFYTVKGRVVKLIEHNGKVKWSHINVYDTPIISNNGEYISVMDKTNNKEISVYGNVGLVYTLTFNDEIIDASVNSNGYIGIIRKKGNSYVAEVYNDKGIQMVERAISDDNRYPISVAVSPDNTMFAVASISTDSLQIKSSVSLVAIYDENNNYDQGVIAGVNLESGIIVGKVLFSKNNIIMYTDKGILINEINNSSLTEVSSYSFDNYIDFVTVVNDNYLAIVLGAEINSSVYTSGTVLFYDFKGKLVGTHISDKSITDISVTDRGLILSKGRIVTNINTSGKELWKYEHTRELNKAFYVGDKTIGLLVENDGITVLEKRR